MRDAALTSTTQKQREGETLRYVCEVLADVCNRKTLRSAMILVAILAQCYRSQEAEVASRGKREAVQSAKATLEVLDYAGELHENWFAVPRVKRVLKKYD